MQRKRLAGVTQTSAYHITAGRIGALLVQRSVSTLRSTSNQHESEAASGRS